MSCSCYQRLLDYLLLLLLLNFAIVSSSSAAQEHQETGGCDAGWMRHDNNCFKIYRNRVFESLARIICRYDDATLASIPNLETLTFLSNQVRPEEMDKFWVGMRLRSDHLMWEDNSIADSDSWVTKPETHQLTSNPCFYFNGERVEPAACLIHIGFICQQKITLNSTKSCPEDTLHAEHMNLCLWVTDSSLPKQESAEACTKRGGSMLDFDGLAKVGLHHLDEFLRSHTMFWTNITWNDTSPVWFDPSTGVMTNLNITDIPTVLDEGTCTILEFDFTNIYPLRLYKLKCHNLAYAICHASPEDMKNFPNVTLASPTSALSTTAQPTQETFARITDSLISENLQCPHGYNWKEDSVTGYCYWETSYETARLSWDAARTYCQSYGGDLASFHNNQEERIGLSFQYGSMSHPYWMGMKYNSTLDKYVWVDGTPVVYENWAPGQPDHKNLRFRCVQMDAAKKEWLASYCGVLSWFICKAPKQNNPKMPVLPKLEPLQSCSEAIASEAYFHNGYCYEPFAQQYNWHRASLYCMDKGAQLVSIHGEIEVDFLIRLLYEDKTVTGNRVWIGLSSLGLDDQLKWSDGTLLDFVHWNNNEPNNYLNQEKCCNMYVGNGLWNDENCNGVMAFVCKRKNDTSGETSTSMPSIPTPAPGNCKKGWHAFRDECYLPVGEKKTDWANFTTAHYRCKGQNGTLTSILDAQEQVFLTFLMQNIKKNMWIGLHDTIQSGVYFWLDNSQLQYTNWALGEPSFLGLQEDCVHLVYNDHDSGIWKDESCEKKLPYICKSRKDPSITTPWIPKSTRCIDPVGWVKRGTSCFKYFYDNKTWFEALEICESYQAKLVSITDVSVQAVFRYLVIDLNVSSWIGLHVNSDHKFQWLNNWPMSMSNWDSNEPATNGKNDLCFISSPSGFWQSTDCQEERPFMCQITGESPPDEKTKSKECKSSDFQAVEGEEDYCYHVEEFLEGYNAYFKCFVHGGHLTSIHSQDQVNRLKTYLKQATQREAPFFIGLTRNKRGGFAWADGSPVDFDYWEEGEPQGSKDMCVEMKAQTLKWRVVSCTIKRNAVCSVKKVVIETKSNSTTEETSSHMGYPQTALHTGLSGGALAAIIVSLLVAVVASITVYIYFRPPNLKHFRLQTPQVTSFENALYDSGSSLELQEEHNSKLLED